MPRRLLGLVLAVAPACLSSSGGPPSETGGSTGESTGEASTGVVDSTGEASSTSGGSEASSSSEGESGSASVGETSSTSSGTSTTDDAETTGPQTSTGSTGGVGSFCGDGTVDPDEECDDMNFDQDDGCSLLCKRRRTVFITSEAYNPLYIGGLDGADSLCRQLARDMGSEHWKTFVAWMSDSQTSALERIFYGYGRYARPDGIIVAHDVEQFVSGKLMAPINVTELGETISDAVWTGTGSDGWAVPGAQHCDDWTSNGLSVKGHIGASSATDSDWTNIAAADANPIPCGVKLRFYCFEGK